MPARPARPGLSHAEARARAHEALALLEISHLAQRSPQALSAARSGAWPSPP
ncbi:hypothetical protein [Kouleothrix sp.]|uniref:hypothetical protein n=1 Tax=Kouleothrix sp. TaxID=2779161 RepID=UPI00391C5A93